MDKESIDSVTKTEANEPSRLSGGDFFITYRAYIAGRLKHGNCTKVKPCFFTKSVRFGRAELPLIFPESSSRDLQSGHGFMLVPGALNETKKTRKAGADIFANLGLTTTATKT